MWGTFVRDCLCVWAVIFLNVCHSQRDGTVLHMLCNSQLELNCQNSVTFPQVCGEWRRVGPMFWHFKCSSPERWELRPDVFSIPQGIWRLGIKDFFLESYDSSKWKNRSTKKQKNSSSALLTRHSLVSPASPPLPNPFFFVLLCVVKHTWTRQSTVVQIQAWAASHFTPWKSCIKANQNHLWVTSTTFCAATSSTWFSDGVSGLESFSPSSNLKANGSRRDFPSLTVEADEPFV